MEGNSTATDIHGDPEMQQPQTQTMTMTMMSGGNPSSSSSLPSADGKMDAPDPDPLVSWHAFRRRVGRKSSSLDKAVNEELHRRPELVGQDVDDLKKLRRRLSNRLSAQRSRIKRANMENSIKKDMQDLKDKLAWLHSEVQAQEEKRTELLQENKSLEKLISAQEKKLAELEIAEREAKLKRPQELGNTTTINGDDDSNTGSQRITELEKLYNEGLEMQRRRYPDLGFYEQAMQNFASIPARPRQVHSSTTAPLSPETSSIFTSLEQQQPDELLLPRLEQSPIEELDFDNIYINKEVDVELAPSSVFDTLW